MRSGFEIPFLLIGRSAEVPRYAAIPDRLSSGWAREAPVGRLSAVADHPTRDWQPPLTVSFLLVASLPDR